MNSTRRIVFSFMIFIILGCCSQSIGGLRILGIFPLHGKSHFVMCERLAKGLAERGHQIDVYSHFPLKKPVPNYKDFSLAGSMPGILNNMSYDYLQQFQSPNLKLMLEQVGNPICELMNLPVFEELFKTVKKNQPYDIVLVEVFVSNCFFAWGRHLNIPMVGIMTSALIDWYNEPLGNPVNTASTPGCWSGFFQPMNFWERLTNTLMYRVISTNFNYHVKSQNKYVEQFFGQGYPDVADLPKDLDLLLVNSHYSFEGIRTYSPAVVPVGGLHVVDDNTKLPNEVQKWLDESKDGCIYFSFGSMVRIETFPKPVLDAFYAAFKTISPVRVLMKIAKPEELPPGLPSNVMTQSWFSQIQVLKHKNVKAFVTHGGLMSMQESIFAGVPLLGIPLYGDQQLNIEVAVRKQIALKIQLKNITENTFTTIVQEILKNPVYKKNAESYSKIFYDRPMSPLNTAIFWIEYLSRHGKKALRSPVVDLPWWQANLIDVYGFLLSGFILIVYLNCLIFKKLKSFCTSTPVDLKRKKSKKLQ